jgi:hypothetical protein
MCAALLAPAGAVAAPDSSVSASAKQAAAAKAKPKKKSTAARVTSLSRSLNRTKANQRAVQKQLDALVKQQSLIGTTVSGAVAQITGAASLSTPAGILAVLQDPASGIPQLLDSITAKATDGIKQLLASSEYAVAVVTVGDAIASPTLLVSADVPDIGAPVTFSGTVPVLLPPGVDHQIVDVQVGAVSLENDGTGAADPVFMATLNHFSVTPAGYTGTVGEADLTGGGAGVNISKVLNGQSTLCLAGQGGCGAPVWSGPNPAFGNLPFWPVTNKLLTFGTQAGVKFDLSKMTSLATAGKLMSITNTGAGPIRVSTDAPHTGLSLLSAEISVTVEDSSINPADPFA